MHARILLVFVVLFVLIEPLAARFLVGGQTFQEMFKRADLVVIATALKTRDTTERKKEIDIDVIETTAPEVLQDEVVWGRNRISGATRNERSARHQEICPPPLQTAGQPGGNRKRASLYTNTFSET